MPSSLATTTTHKAPSPKIVKWPTFLYGPSSSGKSALITKLTRHSGNQVLFIQMDDQIDGRTLVGAYFCTNWPGEFRWHSLSHLPKYLNKVDNITLLVEGATSKDGGVGMCILHCGISYYCHPCIIRVESRFCSRSMGSNHSTSIKAIGITIKLTLDGISQIAYPHTWFFLTIATIYFRKL
ncbi:putative magnesium transporter NIPA7, partial [Mucuna pruriens]